MKKLFLLASLFLVFTIVHATSLTITHEIIKNEIDWDSTAKFKIYVTNQGTQRDICLRTPIWGTIYLSDAKFTLAPGQTKIIDVSIKPPTEVLAGTYGITVLAFPCDNPDDKTAAYLRVVVKSERPHLKATASLEGVTPGNIPLNIIVQNEGSLPVENISIKVSSPFFAPFEVSVPSLKSGEVKLVYSGEFNLPSNTTPGAYELKYDFYVNGQYVRTQTEYISVLGKGVLTVDKSTSGNFLISTTKLTVKNVGNAEAHENISHAVASWQLHFAKISPKPRQEQLPNGVTLLTWDVHLKPQESAVLIYEVNYAPILLGILIAIGICYLGLLTTQHKIECEKSAARSKGAIEVKLRIKNKSNSELKHIVIEDIIPAPFKLAKEFSTLTPVAIKKELGKTKLIWEIDSLYPNEECHISYGIKSTLNIIGKILVPPAKVSYRYDNKKRTTYTNQIIVKSTTK